MIRLRAIKDAKAAGAYYGKSDGGYYLDSSDLRREVGGSGAKRLGLETTPDFDQFRRLLNGLDPRTGEQLTAKLIPNRLAGWDVTASVPKGVSIALERGDTRVQDAIWEAGRETMADLEAHVVTRVRQGGQLADRATGNLIWYGFEHPETRPNREDGMPDPDRHIHFVIPNLTYDAHEHQWKAIKAQPVYELRKWFDRRFDLRLSSKLTDLGYQIETRMKPDPTGSKRYFSWDVEDIPQSVVQKYSRRGAEVDALAEKLGVRSATGKDRLGSTSRQFKRTDMTLDDYRRYWDGRLTHEEKQATAEVIKAAIKGQNPAPTNTADKGVAYALSHEFERRSVVPLTELEITAYERCMGGATPEQVGTEAKRQGVLVRDGDATTRAVLAEESRIIAFAREGRGTMRPLGTRIANPVSETRARSEPQFSLLDDPKQGPNRTFRAHEVAPGPNRLSASVGSEKQPDSAPRLSLEQQAMVAHVLTSPDRVVLVVGDAGTGKTKSVRAAFDAIDRPVEMLAPSASASRGTLRDEGFAKADTVAAFLLSDKRQQAIKDGVIWVDEAGLLPVRDLAKLTEIAKAQDARLVLQGDPKQMKAVVRHGDMLNVLQSHAGLEVGRLTEIWRQKHQGYKAAVADIAAGKLTAGLDRLADLGWVKQAEGNRPLVDAYFDALHTRKAGQSKRDRVLIVAPTHAQGDSITAAIRSRLHADGQLGEDHPVRRLVNLNWSEAEKGDLQRYDGTEWLQFHRNSGTFKAGDRVRSGDFTPTDRFKSGAHFSVFREEVIDLAVGDLVRLTNNGKSAEGRKFNNGTVYAVTGCDTAGIRLDNGATVPNDFGHLAHGYVSTAFAAQGRTADRVLVALGSEGTGAINAEAFYVAASRGRHSATVFTDMSRDTLREAVRRQDRRRSATELMARPPKPRRKRFLDRLKDGYDLLRERAVGVIRGLQPEPENALER